MKSEDREELLALIRNNPKSEVVLPDADYEGDRNTIRTQVGGLKVFLHRWLYDQLNPENPLGQDRLWRDPAHDPRNVNPLLMHRIVAGGPISDTHCPQGHSYAEVGEMARGRSDGRRCRQCWREHRDRRNVIQRIGGQTRGDINKAKTHCKYGHEYTPENTLYWPGDKGRRRCRECETTRAKARYAERKTASGNTQKV
jgi:hypothetical protein